MSAPNPIANPDGSKVLKFKVGPIGKQYMVAQSLLLKTGAPSEFCSSGGEHVEAGENGDQIYLPLVDTKSFDVFVLWLHTSSLGIDFQLIRNKETILEKLQLCLKVYCLAVGMSLEGLQNDAIDTIRQYTDHEQLPPSFVQEVFRVTRKPSSLRILVVCHVWWDIACAQECDSAYDAMLRDNVDIAIEIMHEIAEGYCDDDNNPVSNDPREHSLCFYHNHWSTPRCVQTPNTD